MHMRFEMLNFDTLDLRAQLTIVLHFDVLVGVHGAGADRVTHKACAALSFVRASFDATVVS